MKKIIRTVAVGAVILVAAVLGYINDNKDAGPEQAGNPAAEQPASKAATASGSANSSQQLVRGPNGMTDIGPTLERIKRGERHPHRNDGSVFQNRERLLPAKPRGYYREYVHPTPGIRGPGPQRLVIGQAGEAYYTPDHYRSFVPVKP